MKLDKELVVAHIADVHYRGLSRHDEYKVIFEHFFKECKKLDVDRIFVGGDIFHTKTQGISPEVIEELTWFFRSCGDTAETHLILGNHDLNLTNKKRQDVITPIIDALDHPNLRFYKDSGVYNFSDGVELCVYSCVDEPKWKSVKPTGNNVSIAAFHGAVTGSKTDDGFQLEGDVSLSFFDGHDFVMLGDIHKHQFLDKERRCAYPGSPVQQNYGEDTKKGFLLWKIRGADDFDVDFIELPNPKPFITIEWHDTVTKTLKAAKKVPDGSRIRIKTGKVISQHDIKQLYSELKATKSAEEVVLKNDASYHDGDIGLSDDDAVVKNDLHSPEAHQKLFEEYFKLTGTTLTEVEKKELSQLIKDYVTAVNAESKDVRNVKWSIQKLEFDNLFAYGKGNVIDFTKLMGITGIFGPNRAGKSSIPGSIMYTLWNASDRGSLKNLYMINNRKGACKGRAVVSVSGKEYVIERTTTRYTSKDRREHGITSLDFGVYDPMNDDVAHDGSLRGLQRSDTDKNIKRYIGTADNFLMTSFASQGALNQFIDAGSTNRKAYLAKFLGLEIFDKMHDMAKKRITELKAQLTEVPEESWLPKINALIEKRAASTEIIVDCEGQINDLRDKLRTLNADIAEYGGTVYAYNDLDASQKKVWAIEKKIANANDQKYKLGSDIHDFTAKISVLEEHVTSFDPDALRDSVEELSKLRSHMKTKGQALAHERKLIARLQKSIGNLNDIPCGDSFPKCKFIKDSYNDKSKLPDHMDRVELLEKEISELSVIIEERESHDYEAMLADYRRAKADLQKAKGSVSTLELSSARLDTTIATLSSELESAQAVFNEIKRVCSNADELKKAEELYSLYESQVSELDKSRLDAARALGHAETELKRMKEAHETFKKQGKELRRFELFHQATSKKGVPSLVLRRLAPAINAELAKILHGVVDFTVELEPSELSSAIDIFINYGDSKRVIEVGSGMEKMIASLALRVALINISSLPKTDLFIIDEGFGALDESNVDACNKLLVSLKKWFRNILVITHVDGVKDVVDNMFEITKKGKDSHIEYI